MATFKHQLFTALQSVAGRRGIWIDRASHQPHARRSQLMRAHHVNHVFDVGAHRGGYALRLRQHGFRGRITSFEPLPGAFAQIARLSEADPDWRVRNVALAAVEGTANFHVAANEVSSSLRSMRPRHAEVAPESAEHGTIEVSLRTVDQETAQHGLPQMLKIDVQGAESEVLDGATEALDQVRLIELELSFVELYEGQDLVELMISRLRSCGFAPAAFFPGFTDVRDGRGLQADGIFVRD